MRIKDLINKEMVWIEANLANKEALFALVGAKASSKNLASADFGLQLAQREDMFPTGIALPDYGVAIPHTDAQYIKKPFISVLTLKEPVSFSAMEDQNKRVQAKLVFVLGLSEAYAQLAVLQELMQTIQNKTLVEQLLRAKTTAEIIRCFDHNLSEGGGVDE